MTAPGGESAPPSGSSHRGRADSRHYRYAFAIQSLSELPPDFTGFPDPGPLEAGVFLPQDDASWLGRRAYPARVLLVTSREILVAAHPAEREPLLRAPIREIHSAQCGRILLLGWFEFVWSGGRKRLPYNTRTRSPVERCIRVFKELWLPPQARRTQPCTVFGKPLTLKFEYAESAELLPGETVLVRFFQPAVRRERGYALFRREIWLPGDLVLATSRRLLWITDRYKGRQEPYGSISYSAPWSSLTRVDASAASPGAELTVHFGSAQAWRIPLRDMTEQEANLIREAIEEACRAS